MKVKSYKILFHVLLGVAFYVMPFSHVDAQNKVSVSFEKKSIDYQNKIICYDLLLTNTGNADWNLSGQNYRLYYNSLDVSIIPDSLISYLDISDYSGLVVVQSLENLDAGFVNGNLTYEDNLGFLNCFIDLVDVNNGGIIIPLNNSLSVAQLCFTIELSEPDEFCFELDCAEDPTTMGYANAFINISEWINMNTQTSLDIDILTGIATTNTDISCIDFIENDLISCTDGLDNDEDGFIDCLDFSCNTIDIYCEGSLSSCGDGVDNDGDGDVDCDDSDCGIPMILSIEITEITNCPEENNGSIKVIADQLNFEYSIDGGISYQMDSIFSDLTVGEYMISVRNKSTGCIANLDSIVNILDLDCPPIIEDCGDGFDNDGDGDIDCDDSDCGIPMILSIEITEITNCPEENNGSIKVIADQLNFEYSIDGGISYQMDSIFLDLTVGEYMISVRNTSTGCIANLDSIVNIIDLDCPPIIEDCGDDFDNDGDGDIDCDDSDCGIPMILSIEITEITNCPEENNGSIKVIADQLNFEYSIDGGISYQMDSIFSDLTVGEYMISVRNTSTGCIANLDSIVNILDLDCSPIIEDCGDGFDNDGDGDIDCDDMDCIDFCDQFEIFIPNCFSPLKRDNVNDVFFIHCVDPNEFSAYDFFIYDRWGALVKEGNGIFVEGENVIWDGTFRNQLVNSGVYIFYMKSFHENENIFHSTTITVF